MGDGRPDHDHAARRFPPGVPGRDHRRGRRRVDRQAPRQGRRRGDRRRSRGRPRATARRRRPGGDHHRRHRRRPPRAAPLDGPRDGPGGHPAVPRRQVLDRPGDRERLLLRLRAARRGDVLRRRPRRHRGADARDRQGRPAVRPLRGQRRRGARRLRRPAVQGRDHRARPGARRRRRRRRPRRRRGRCRRHGERVPQQRRVRRPVQGTARPVDGPARPLQAAEGRRRLLAGQREGPDAAAHLRHGVGVRGRVAGPSRPARRGREARPPQARPTSSTCSASRTRSAAAWPSGTPRAPSCARIIEDYSRRRHERWRLRVRVHAAPHQRQAVRDSRDTCPGTPRACTRRWRWTTARTTSSR